MATLWRAVSDAERADIEATGRFRLPPGGGTGHKYFAIDRAGAERMAQAFLQREATTRLTLFCADSPDDLAGPGARRFREATAEGPVDAVLLHAADLPRLGPARMIGPVESDS